MCLELRVLLSELIGEDSAWNQLLLSSGAEVVQEYVNGMSHHFLALRWTNLDVCCCLEDRDTDANAICHEC